MLCPNQFGPSLGGDRTVDHRARQVEHRRPARGENDGGHRRCGQVHVANGGELGAVVDDGPVDSGPLGVIDGGVQTGR